MSPVSVAQRGGHPQITYLYLPIRRWVKYIDILSTPALSCPQNVEEVLKGVFTMESPVFVVDCLEFDKPVGALTSTVHIICREFIVANAGKRTLLDGHSC